MLFHPIDHNRIVRPSRKDVLPPFGGIVLVVPRICHVNAAMRIGHDIQLVFVLVPGPKRPAVKEEIRIIRPPPGPHDKVPCIGKRT